MPGACAPRVIHRRTDNRSLGAKDLKHSSSLANESTIILFQKAYTRLRDAIKMISLLFTFVQEIITSVCSTILINITNRQKDVRFSSGIPELPVNSGGYMSGEATWGL